MSETDELAELKAQIAELKKSQQGATEEAPSLRAVAAATDPDKPLFVHCKGERFRLSRLDEVDIDVLEAFEDGKTIRILKGVLGPQAVARIRALHGGTLSVPDVEPIAKQIAKAYGFTSTGESAASSS